MMQDMVAKGKQAKHDEQARGEVDRCRFDTTACRFRPDPMC